MRRAAACAGMVERAQRRPRITVCRRRAAGRLRGLRGAESGVVARAAPRSAAARGSTPIPRSSPLTGGSSANATASRNAGLVPRQHAFGAARTTRCPVAGAVTVRQRCVACMQRRVTTAGKRRVEAGERMGCEVGLMTSRMGRGGCEKDHRLDAGGPPEFCSGDRRLLLLVVALARVATRLTAATLVVVAVLVAVP